MCFGGNPRIGFLKGRPLTDEYEITSYRVRPTTFSLLAYKRLLTGYDKVTTRKEALLLCQICLLAGRVND